MIKQTLLLFPLFLVIVCSINVLAQRDIKSLYSNFGIGDQASISSSANFGLAGASAALNEKSFINHYNPASYASLDMTVFDAGFRLRRLEINEEGNRSVIPGGDFLSFSLGFPIAKNAGMAFGLKPYSTMGYQFTNTLYFDGVGTTRYDFNGFGNFNQAFVGAAYKIKNFSFGFNIAFLFGRIRRVQDLIISDRNVFNTRMLDETLITNFIYDAGAQYTLKFGQNRKLVLGASLKPLTSITARRNFVVYNFARTTFDIPLDTLEKKLEESGKIQLPSSIQAGANFSLNNKISFLLEYQSTDWSSFRSFGVQDDNRGASYSYIAGVTYIPKGGTEILNTGNIILRLGYRYTNTGIIVRETAIYESGINIGMSIPIKKSRSSVNIGFEYGTRGTISSGLIKENFYLMNVGLSINDKWFIKRKYD